jgi:hypothetical protein
VDGRRIPVENCPEPVYSPWDNAVDKQTISQQNLI